MSFTATRTPGSKKFDLDQLRKNLAHEMSASSIYQPPLIVEEIDLGSNRCRLVVIWDELEGVPPAERTNIILGAYEDAFGAQRRARVALAVGKTFPEAKDSGMLPFAIVTTLRSDDPVTVDQCRAAMIAEGASILRMPAELLLRFQTIEQAEDCRRRLLNRLPGSDKVWAILHEIPVFA